MFGKRKRKEEEDEPLVPHGLIWHATSEPEAPQNPGPTLQKAEPPRQPVAELTPALTADPIASPPRPPAVSIKAQPLPAPKSRQELQAPLREDGQKPDQKP